MQTVNQTLFTRDDTIFGVCEGLGTDLGISPNLFRIAFGVSLLGNPLISIAAYLVCGALVAATRRAFPLRAKSAAAPVVQSDALNAENDTQAPEFALAA